jgi:hypothetical protein
MKTFLKKIEYQIITNSNYIKFCDNVSLTLFSFPFQMQCILLLFFNLGPLMTKLKVLILCFLHFTNLSIRKNCKMNHTLGFHFTLKPMFQSYL